MADENDRDVCVDNSGGVAGRSTELGTLSVIAELMCVWVSPTDHCLHADASTDRRMLTMMRASAAVALPFQLSRYRWRTHQCSSYRSCCSHHCAVRAGDDDRHGTQRFHAPPQRTCRRHHPPPRTSDQLVLSSPRPACYLRADESSLLVKAGHRRKNENAKQ